MLKSEADVKAALARLYDRVWAEEAVGSSNKEWPQRLPLGSCTKNELEERFVAICEAADKLFAQAVRLNLAIESTTRLVGGSKQSLPTHVAVGDMHALAAALGRRREYALVCERAERLAREFPLIEAADRARLLRKMQQIVPDELDFDLACRAGAWFAHNDARGLTPRQVPLVGFHAKWLDAKGRAAVVAQLAGLEELPLEQRPPQVRFTYLDPSYLQSGGRRFDSWVLGDVAAKLPYAPRVVVVCENRDTALWFPHVDGSIAVMGDGFAAIRNLPALDWVRNAPLLVYWGDMDAAGLEILAGCREAGLECVSMLMDMRAFEEYGRYGTNVDKQGKLISPKTPCELPALTPEERELYLNLVDPAWTRPRRIEQERIPLDAALCELEKLR